MVVNVMGRREIKQGKRIREVLEVVIFKVLLDNFKDLKQMRK